MVGDLAQSEPAGPEPLPPVLSPRSKGTGPRPSLGAIVRRAVPFVPAFVPLAIVVAIIVTLIIETGLTHLPGLLGSNFNPTPSTGAPSWGIMVFVVGSFLTAVPALLLSMVVGLGIAIASVTYLPRFVSRILDPFVDLLAGIPSVVYGIWGYLFVSTYFGNTLNPFLYDKLSWIPGFGGQTPPGSGLGIPISVFILTLMALPITTLLIRDALRTVPRDLWESGLALGATRWEVLRRVSIPYGRAGILSAAFLGFGRAFGETVAVAMVINIEPVYPHNVFQGTGTIASLMFALLDSAYGNYQFLAALCYMALALLAITLVVNVVGRWSISRLSATEIAGL